MQRQSHFRKFWRGFVNYGVLKKALQIFLKNEKQYRDCVVPSTPPVAIGNDDPVNHTLDKGTEPGYRCRRKQSTRRSIPVFSLWLSCRQTLKLVSMSSIACDKPISIRSVCGLMYRQVAKYFCSSGVTCKTAGSCHPTKISAKMNSMLLGGHPVQVGRSVSLQRGRGRRLGGGGSKELWIVLPKAGRYPPSTKDRLDETRHDQIDSANMFESRTT